MTELTAGDVFNTSGTNIQIQKAGTVEFAVRLVNPFFPASGALTAVEVIRTNVAQPTRFLLLDRAIVPIGEIYDLHLNGACDAVPGDQIWVRRGSGTGFGALSWIYAGAGSEAFVTAGISLTWTGVR